HRDDAREHRDDAALQDVAIGVLSRALLHPPVESVEPVDRAALPAQTPEVQDDEDEQDPSAPRSIPLERMAQLSHADVARVDTIAEALGVSRHEAMVRILATWLPVLEAKHGKGPPSGPRKG